MNNAFVRQVEIKRNLITMLAPQFSNPPFSMTYHHESLEEMMILLEDQKTVNAGIDNSTFLVKDGVLGLFKSLASMSESGWSFASSNVVDVLAAVRIGEVLDIQFDTPFSEVFNIERYHFPSGVPDSGYGQFRFHIKEDVVTSTGFKIISSFEVDQEPTSSRLPFFLGFRVYGRKLEEDIEPVWRSLLALSIRYCQEEKWHLSILHTAFSLESIIDILLTQHMQTSRFPQEYIDHILRIGEKRYELHALNEIILQSRLSKKEVNSLSESLNQSVFTKRNKVAHGLASGDSITREDAIDAIIKTVDFIWEFARNFRKDLLITTGARTFENMIDAELIESCMAELKSE